MKPKVNIETHSFIDTEEKISKAYFVTSESKRAVSVTYQRIERGKVVKEGQSQSDSFDVSFRGDAEMGARIRKAFEYAITLCGVGAKSNEPF